MTEPRVYNRFHKDAPRGSVFIGRPSIWGNPFVIGKHGGREEVIEQYKKWFLSQPVLMQETIEKLRGQNLVCYCSPKPCHGDFLLEFANG